MGEAHKIPDDEEVSREPQSPDHPELVLYLPAMCLRRKNFSTALVRSPSLLRPLDHEPLEILVRGHTERQWKRRECRLELFHAECAALGDRARGGDTLQR